LITDNGAFDIKNRHLLVLVASKRARQIVKGSPFLVKTKYKKPTSVALEELKNKKVEFKMKE
jgi:DNA-directed RNA polymerase omega subunit